MEMVNKQKITPELCRNNDLVFFPKTTDEALVIQQKLFALGCRWVHNGVEVSELQNCVERGMVSQSGTLYYNPQLEKPHLRCSVEQFEGTYVPPDQAFMLELFNKISGRLDGIEKRLSAIEENLSPVSLDKAAPRLRPKGGAL